MVRLLRKFTRIGDRLKLIRITLTSTLCLCPFKKFQQPPSTWVQGCGFIHMHHKHALTHTEAQEYTSLNYAFLLVIIPRNYFCMQVKVHLSTFLNGIWYWFVCVKAATKQATADKIPNKLRIPQEISLDWILRRYCTIHCAVTVHNSLYSFQNLYWNAFFEHLVMLLRILYIFPRLKCFTVNWCWSSLNGNVVAPKGQWSSCLFKSETVHAYIMFSATSEENRLLSHLSELT